MQLNVNNYKIIDVIDKREDFTFFRIESNEKRYILKKLNPNREIVEEKYILQNEFIIGEKCSQKSMNCLKPLKISEYSRMFYEECEGETLKNSITNGKIGINEFFIIAKQILKILKDIHDIGYIYKGINPHNILYSHKKNSIKIIDFQNTSEILTGKGEFKNGAAFGIGKVEYISPEQTGRMNRNIDYRSDFYSLGILLYEMASGRLPFIEKDPLKIIHFHIAKKPLLITEYNKDIPFSVAKIIEKLLAKNPEERYQSVNGILEDLEIAERNYSNYIFEREFMPGNYDLYDKFIISDKIYGREREKEILSRGYFDVKNGLKTIALVEGLSGMGKSVLVNEILKLISEDNGNFISGKFDELKRGIPYFPIIEALKRFVMQIMEFEETIKEQYIKKIKDGIGSNGELLTSIVPELELLIGKQVKLEKLSPKEEKNRFFIAVQNFFKCLTTNGNSFVIFIDDLQWCDISTLEMLNSLIYDESIKNLYVIFAYRSNEVFKGHIFDVTVEEYRKTGISINTVSVHTLDIESVKELIADTLNIKDNSINEFVSFCFEKSLGSPFMLNTILKNMYTNKEISYDIKVGKWHVNFENLKNKLQDNDVNILVKEAIAKYDAVTEELLISAAWLGNRFDLKTLSAVTGIDKGKCSQKLYEPMKDGVIIPEADNYRFAGIGNDIEVYYRFAHDKIYFACHYLLSEDMREKMHIKIAELLSKENIQNSEIFMIVNHYNKIKEIKKYFSNEKIFEIAVLNLNAGKQAKKSAAYDAALEYFKNARKLLDFESYWLKEHGLMIDLNTNICETAYLTSEYYEMEKAFSIVEKNGRNIQEKLAAYEIIIQAHVARNRPAEAVETALNVLNQLNVKFPKSLKKTFAYLSLISVSVSLSRIDSQKIVTMPEIQSNNLIAAMRIMTSIAAASFIVDTDLYILITMKMTEISIKNGLCKYSAFAFVNFGLIMSAALFQVDTGYKYGNIAIDILNRFNAEDLKAKVYMVYNTTIRYFKEPISNSYKQLFEGYIKGIENGDFEYGTYDLCIYGYNSFFAGKNLNEYVNEFDGFAGIIKRLNQNTQYNYLGLFLETVNNLKKNISKVEMKGTIYNEYELLSVHKEKNDRHAIFNLNFLKMMTNIFYENYDEAILQSKEAEKYITSVMGFIVYSEYIFYDTILKLEIMKKYGLVKSIKYWKDILRNSIKLIIWKKGCPYNFENKWKLVKAEIMSFVGFKSIAERLYEEALAVSKGREFINEEGLASFITAKYYIREGKKTVAGFFIERALNCFKTWGAEGLKDKIYSLYGEVIYRKYNTISENMSEMDVNSLIKLTNILSKDLQLSVFVKNILDILMENSGADRVLFLMENNERFFVETEKKVDSDAVEIGLSVSEYSEISKRVIYHVIESGKQIIYGDVEGEGGEYVDSYLIKNRIKSLFCIPLKENGEVKAIIYMENRVTNNVFSDKSASIFSIFASSIEILLKNARLYTQVVGYNKNLQNEVKRRTAELQEKTAEAERAAKIKSEFLSNMSHEIRTPIGAIIGFTNLMMKTPLNIKQKDYASKIETSSKNLLGIINDILDFSKIENGKLIFENIDFNYEESINFVLSVMTEKASAKGVELINYIADDVPKRLKGDPLRFAQILTNLVGNAVKFTEKGYIAVKTDFIEEKEEHIILQIEVEDTGIGIKEENISNLFKEFTQADNSVTRKYGGTGLGLTISKKLVEMFGGEISVKSHYGKGTTFIFTLTFEKVSEIGTVPSAVMLMEKIKELKVLIVDDNDLVRESLEIQISSFGMRYKSVSSGLEALQELRNSSKNDPYQLVLMDWNMPEMDGITAAEKIRSDSEIEQTPVMIMVTAFGKEEIENKAKNIGINGFLIKPVNSSILFNTIVDIFAGNKKQSSDSRYFLKNAEEESDYKFEAADVLLVEDMELNQEVAEEILKSMGLNVEIVSNGKEAVKAVKNRKYSVILMDIQMPEMGGYEATKIIREELKNTEVPIIAMTAHAMPGIKEECIEVGMDDYVTKPINIKELAKALSKWIKICDIKESKIEEIGGFVKEEVPENMELKEKLIKIRGLNFELGLKRVFGNEKFYIKMLRHFLERYPDGVKSICKLIEDKEYENAERAAHSLKGISGNIALELIYDSASEVEKNIHIGKYEAAMILLKTTDYEVKESCRGIKEFLENESSINKSLDKQEYTESEKKLFIEEFNKMVKNNELSAEENIEKLKKCIVEKFSNEINEIELRLKQFDFKKAETIMEELIKKI